MSRLLLLALISAAIMAPQTRDGRSYGRPASAEEILSRDITVFPNGTGLPPGKGTAARGLQLFELKCVRCHNHRGEGRLGQYPALAGGVGSLASKKPKKTVGSYWPHATTVWDFINRAMPFNQPRSLTPDEVYSLTAYVLHLNGIVKESDELNQTTLPAIRMPNRDGFIGDPRPDIKARR